jgi:quercetin dioxygenase-like cupin family protein
MLSLFFGTPYDHQDPSVKRNSTRVDSHRFESLSRSGPHGPLKLSCDATSETRIRRERQQKMALKMPRAALTVAVTLSVTVAVWPAAHADPPPQNPGQIPVVRTVFDKPTDVAGKSLETVTVSYPPGAKSAAHHHAKSAFIMAYVISGAIRSQLEGEPARIYHAGETWSEAPGAHHTISENASATEPAELLAVFLVDTGDGPLTTDDTTEK